MHDLYRATCLTPVHVGSGAELIRDVDFFSEGERTYVLDPERLIAAGGGISGLAEALVARKSVGDVLRGHRFDPASLASHTITGRVEAQKIRVALRTADGRPMLPGSSIKGALRTLLLVGWSAHGKPHGDRGSAAETIITRAVQTRSERERSRVIDNGFFRSRRLPDPQGDILRGLKVSDAVFPSDQLAIFSSVAVGTTRTTLTAAESLQSKAIAVIRLRLDGEPLLRELACPHPLPSWNELAEWSRAHAQHLLDGDQRYFAERSAEGPRARCEELLTQIKTLPGNALVLRLGWGTGWRTMTGDILSVAERNQVVRRVGKTRKVIVDGHAHRSRPEDIFGWIRLDPISLEESQSLFIAPLAPALVAAATPEDRLPRVSTTPITDPFLDRLRKFQAREFGQLRDLLQQCESRPDRDTCMHFLATRLLALYGADKRQLKALRQKYPALAPHLLKP
jgi:CRISPR type III-A-associated RAMP protein Csm5